MPFPFQSMNRLRGPILTPDLGSESGLEVALALEQQAWEFSQRPHLWRPQCGHRTTSPLILGQRAPVFNEPWAFQPPEVLNFRPAGRNLSPQVVYTVPLTWWTGSSLTVCLCNATRRLLLTRFRSPDPFVSF